MPDAGLHMQQAVAAGLHRSRYKHYAQVAFTSHPEDGTCVLCAGGQVISAVVGVCIRLALDKVQWLANAVGMSLALLAMQLTQTTHPPGGATALIACSMAQLPAW